MRPPDRSFGFLLYDSARLLRRDFDRRARAIGLTRAQWSVLSHLNRYEGVNQAALADLMEIEGEDGFRIAAYRRAASRIRWGVRKLIETSPPSMSMKIMSMPSGILRSRKFPGESSSRMAPP